MSEVESGDLLSEFLQPNFDVEGYARQLVDRSVSLTQQLISLVSGTTELEKQLKEQISAHYEKLLLQATSIEALEDVLSTINQHVVILQSCVDRARDHVGDLFRRTDIRTRQLERLHETCTLLRSIIRVWQLMSRMAGGAAKDIAKSSQYVQELKDLVDEVDLHGINVVEREVLALPKMFSDVISQSRSTLRQGLQTQNHSLVSTALQSLLNLRCLDEQLASVRNSMIEETKQCLANFGRVDQPTSVSTSSEEKRNTTSSHPGGVSFSSPASASMVVRANLWMDVGRFVELLLGFDTQLKVLRTVAGRKRDQISHRLLNDWIGEDYFTTFWIKLSEEAIRGKLFPSSEFSLSANEAVVRQTLESEYPRFLRSLNGIFRRLKESGMEEYGSILRDAFRPLEIAYTGKSLSRLFDSVNLAFSAVDTTGTGGQRTTGETVSTPPHNQEIDTVVQAINTEISVSNFDAHLFESICHNVGKVIRLFGVKCEQLLCTDGEASQVIGNPSSGQRRNIDIVNAINYFRNQVLSSLDRLSVSPPSVIQEALSNLENLMSVAVSPLLKSVEDAISAIIVTMHQEDFSYPIDRKEKSQQQPQQQCSLYMRELQDFIIRVWKDYLAPFECTDFVYHSSTEVATTACRLFILHATLIRPLGDGGRLRLAADFAQMELAISPLCRRVSDLGDVYIWLRSLRPLLFQTPQEIVSNLSAKLDQKPSVPYSILIQLIVSRSPSELQSPHVTAAWSVTRYVEWLESHPSELDRLQLLRGTLEAYARSVQAEGKTNYVPTYPLILDLLKNGFDEATAVSKVTSY